MILAIIITILSFALLVILHELGHFLTAKKFKMKVEEFGIGIPPRIWGKKIGETVYSFNFIPLGGFVKIYGEDNPEEKGEGSFSQKPVWQRILVVSAGVLAFWVVAFIIFSLVFWLYGVPKPVEDNFQGKAQIQIIKVEEGYPAQKAGFKPLDFIIGAKENGKIIKINKIEDLKNFIKSNKDKGIIFLVKRGKETKEIKAVPNEEGLIGIQLLRVAQVKYPLASALVEGAKETLSKTRLVFWGILNFFQRLILGKGVSLNEVRGPVGIGEIFVSIFNFGLGYYLYFIALISIYLAVFNILPIPALDGGRLVFLLIEAVRKKPISPKLEAQIHGLFFIVLLLLMLIVTFFDIKRIL